MNNDYDGWVKTASICSEYSVSNILPCLHVPRGNAITACVEFKVTIEYHVSPYDHGSKPEASNKIAKT